MLKGRFSTKGEVEGTRVKNVMMAMPTTIDKTGVHFTEPTGTEEELEIGRAHV